MRAGRKEASRAVYCVTDPCEKCAGPAKDQPAGSHTKRVDAAPRMHAQAPQVSTGCWPRSRGISASLCSQPAAPKTA